MNPLVSAVVIWTATLATGLAAPDQEDDIAAIRKLYAKIQESEALTTRKIPFELENDPMSGTITRREYADGLLAITLSYVAGDHGGSEEHFYYQDGKLFFIFTQDSHWRFGPNSTAEKPVNVDTLTETRYYIRDGACFRALRRSAESEKAKKLPSLIAKVPQRKVEVPNHHLKRRLQHAKGLLIVNRGAMADDFFESLTH